MNNKGFAITTMIFGTMILFMLLLVSLLGILSTYRNNLQKLVDSDEGTRELVKIKEIGCNSNDELSGSTMRGLYCVEEDSGKKCEYIVKSGDGDTMLCDVNLDPVLFTYNGNFQTFTAPASGYYFIELKGASGGKAICQGSVCNTNAKGGYVSGYINLNVNDTLYVYVGGAGANAVEKKNSQGGFNGGGNGTWDNNDDEAAGGGGGATDIRLISGDWNDSTSLNSRIMVAGGGGGKSYTDDSNSNVGGGIFGGNASIALGGTQTGGGNFGAGVNGTGTGYSNGVAGGGGGYYGGNISTITNKDNNSAGSGSGFISGYAGVNAIYGANDRTHTNNTLHYSGKYFLNGSMESGAANVGNGEAVITYVGRSMTRKNPKLNNVKYVKDCIAGNSSNGWNAWVEIQAIYLGNNVALGKTVSGITENTAPATGGAGPISYITDGDISSSKWVNTTAEGTYTNECATIDLGKTYNLDEIAVWHYWSGGRTYKENVTYVSSDGIDWTPVIANNDPETVNGKRVSAYTEER